MYGTVEPLPLLACTCCGQMFRQHRDDESLCIACRDKTPRHSDR